MPAGGVGPHIDIKTEHFYGLECFSECWPKFDMMKTDWLPRRPTDTPPPRTHAHDQVRAKQVDLTSFGDYAIWTTVAYVHDLH